MDQRLVLVYLRACTVTQTRISCVDVGCHRRDKSPLSGTRSLDIAAVRTGPPGLE